MKEQMTKVVTGEKRDKINCILYYTVKPRLSERRLSKTTGFFEEDRRSLFFSLLFIAIKLQIFRISTFRKVAIF